MQIEASKVPQKSELLLAPTNLCSVRLPARRPSVTTGNGRANVLAGTNAEDPDGVLDNGYPRLFQDAF
jgi:hypothetical protein